MTNIEVRIRYIGVEAVSSIPYEVEDFEAERTRILQAFEENTSSVLVLGGDECKASIRLLSVASLWIFRVKNPVNLPISGTYTINTATPDHRAAAGTVPI